MFFKLFNKATITIYMSTRLFVSSTCLTGFSIIFIYLLFQRASLAPLSTLDFWFVKLVTSVCSGESFGALLNKT